MHLIRNAIDHGIEHSSTRISQGKPEVGKITLGVSRERGRVILTLSDDGKGIDFEQVRQHAVEQNQLADTEEVTQELLLQMLYQDGFSLAETITETSGRGVGLNIVFREIVRLQGTMRVDSVPGQGTYFCHFSPDYLGNHACIICKKWSGNIRCPT